jgi:hypothetical protein
MFKVTGYRFLSTPNCLLPTGVGLFPYSCRAVLVYFSAGVSGSHFSQIEHVGNQADPPQYPVLFINLSEGMAYAHFTADMAIMKVGWIITKNVIIFLKYGV